MLRNLEADRQIEATIAADRLFQILPLDIESASINEMLVLDPGTFKTKDFHCI
jgi:hypothetical protein